MSTAVSTSPVIDALEAVARTTGAEKLTERLETAIDPQTDALLKALAAELAGGAGRSLRSRVARDLIRRGALALREERAAQARRTR